MEAGEESHNAHLPFEISYCQDEEKQLITFWIPLRSVETFTALVPEHHPLAGSPAARYI